MSCGIGSAPAPGPSAVGAGGGAGAPLDELDVGIVHEWMTNRAGAERCLASFRRLFPRHHVYTSLYASDAFGVSEAVSTSVLQRRFGRRDGHLAAGPLLPLAMASMSVPARHDVVIYGFHHFATWVRREDPSVPSIVYCYTPPRFAYRTDTMADETKPILRLARTVAPVARQIDRRISARRGRFTRYVAISEAVADRVRDAYGIDPTVIHPPVDVEGFSENLRPDPSGDYFLMAGRLVGYKNPFAAMDAFRSIDSELVVVGGGRMQEELRKRAPTNVRFLGRVSDQELAGLYANARGLVFPGEDDFGIVPVEAMASGCPVVALGRGGVCDYLQEGVNGLAVHDMSPAAWVDGVRRLAGTSWDRSAVSDSVRWLGEARFHAAFAEAVADTMR